MSAVKRHCIMAPRELTCVRTHVHVYVCVIIAWEHSSECVVGRVADHSRIGSRVEAGHSVSKAGHTARYDTSENHAYNCGI